jgi:type VI protein secretion system component VasF
MALTELCEPLFQYICLLNRSARKGANYGLNQVRSEVTGILGDIRAKAATDPKLAAAYASVEPVLLFFVDSMIKNSNLGFAADWQELAHEIDEYDGDEKFFDMLDDALRDPAADAVMRLRVFYTCLGLGFTGWYAGQTELLRKRMLEISARIRGVTEADHASRIIPEAYEHVNTGNLIDPPGASLTGIGIALGGLLIVLFVANMYLYKSSSRNMNEAIQNIVRTDAAPPPGAAPAPAPAPASAGAGRHRPAADGGLASE